MYRKKITGWLTGIIISSFLFACSHSTISVHTEKVPTPELQHLKKFGIVRLSADQPQLERTLLTLVRENLEAKGFQYVNEQPDFLVAVKFFSGKVTEYVPPTTLVLRDFYPDRTGRRDDDLRRSGIRRTQADRMRSDVRKSLHTFAGYVDTLDYQNIQVLFVRPVDKETVDILWRGIVDSYAEKGDLSKLAPKMISELMEEFPPDASNKHR
ncbi:MAG: DUF4136 domain-containing protein [Calditrichaeota bacterium]|nr:MAG: DUF4136 domain-containing protein [Calditrichota bacterium]